MINTIEAIAESENGNRVASYEPVSHVIAVICGSLVRRCILSMLALCSTVALVAAIANAQDLAPSTSNAARLANGGWWSHDKAEFATAPQLLVSMAELTHFEASASLRTSPAQPTSYLTEPRDGSIANSQYFGLTLDASVAKQALWADLVSLPPRSLLSLLQTKYTVWESSLSDSRSLTNVNGVSVYPLLQINYAGWHLPVTLYISPLRGSDPR